jgi:hypothetical protein
MGTARMGTGALFNIVIPSNEHGGIAAKCDPIIIAWITQNNRITNSVFCYKIIDFVLFLF